ncbi:Ig-like domain-containing domain [Pseudopedobacter sp.]|uniref:Ig-like domain-containing domain n=1 Tax=Pseudopedobacter sp. TaxID=1936787 RepID=UPI0033421D5C
MILNNKQKKNSNFYAIILAILITYSCASIQQPEGGPKDIEAPVLLNESPKNYTRNFNSKKIVLEFDEYFKLNNEFTEISISPTQEVPPIYKVKKKTLEIELKDTLEKNTTYTINFGKAIGDVNEGNKFKDYTYVFSTGNEIDSLQISGQVTDYLDNKPILEATIFLLPIERDTLFGKKRASIFTVTDSSGNFKLKNLKEHKYRLYALKEEGGGDRIYNNPKEAIGFVTNDINLNKDTSGIKIKLFRQNADEYRNVDRRIEKDGRIAIIYNRPLDNPDFKIIDPIVKDPIIEYSKNADTTIMWLKDMTFDSLKIVTNSGDRILDTLVIRRNKKDTYTRNILFNTNLVSGKIVPNTPFILTFNAPIESIDRSKIKLLQDSMQLPNYQIESIDKFKKAYKITFPWKIKKPYTLNLEEDAITDIYGTKNKAVKVGFELDEIENYGNLTLNINRADTSKNYVVQLLGEKLNLIKENVVTQDQLFMYNMLPNGKYQVRLIEDINKNGVFDSGNVKRREQPENIWFYDKEIVIRPNWDREEKITIPTSFN